MTWFRSASPLCHNYSSTLLLAPIPRKELSKVMLLKGKLLNDLKNDLDLDE